MNFLKFDAGLIGVNLQFLLARLVDSENTRHVNV